MKNAIAILSLIAVLSIGCKDVKKEQGPTQMEQVMAIHDEVMPKMGRLGELVGQLKEKVDTTEAGKQYEAAMLDLQKSNENMMQWMMGFGDRFDSEEILEGKPLTDQKKAWLAEEEVKVKQLKETINQNIEKAEMLLEEE
ncbi:MAG: hypothetical protein AAGD88_13055 [Bacteroidota bacterium]